MKLYSRKLKRNIERQIHFGVGRSTKTACGLVLFSRHVMVSIFSNNDGAVITDDISRVTCKRCLATSDVRLRRLIAIESLVPGIFDHPSLCGEAWLLNHSLNVPQKEIDAQALSVTVGKRTLTLPNTLKRKNVRQILSSLEK